MSELSFLPNLPSHFTPPILFGVLLLVGFFGGEVARRNDSFWLREQLKKSGSLNDVARLQSNLWMGKPERA
ncbi:MAG TPA: hypothetical protein VHE58_05360 [Burkholderiales bacterium]|nr:hypothetical protein [Burkholderiales bacterium]